METTYHGRRQRTLPLSSLTSRALHRQRTGGTRRRPMLVTVMYVGPNPFGKRGGTSGDPVDAIDVAIDAAAESALLNTLSDDTLLTLRQALGHPLTKSDLDRLKEVGITDALTLSRAVQNGELKEILS